MRLRQLAHAAFTLVLVACAAAPVRYYTLANAAPPAPAAISTLAPDGNARIQIELAPVGVPERLARPQIVVRSDADPSSTGVRLLEQQRWSSSFDSELRDSFGVAIAARLGAVDVTRGGHLPGLPVYRVAIQLRQFDATLDRQVDARFGWTITRSDDDRSAVCQAFASQPVAPGIDELVQGIQRAVAATADRIAAQIARLHEGRAVSCEGPVGGSRAARGAVAAGIR
jgi:uncharacterized lipoprotein YmbA